MSNLANNAQHLKDAREVALLALHATEKQGAWSDAALKKMLSGLSARDSALATRLCFGVLQQRLLLDFYIQQFSKLPLKRLEHLVLQNLRLAVYQILFMDKIPDNASVDAAVRLTKKHCKNPKAGGMVNGILRNFIRQMDNLPEIPTEPPLEALSIQYSHPLPLLHLLSKSVPEEELASLLESNNKQPPITAMVNTQQSTQEELISALEEEGVTVSPHPWLKDCLLLSNTGNLSKLKSFTEGLFYVQDPASRLAVLCSGAKAGQKVLDCCAAPGGKSMALGIQMENRGEILSCDLHPHKKNLIEASASRLKLDCITAETANAKEFHPEFVESFDLVLVDAPCSGLGVIRKKPDIRYKDVEPLATLPKIQAEILHNVSQYVKPGAVLVYATCTILPGENQEIIQDFCENHPDFSLESFTLPHIGECSQGYLTLYPHIHETDGFFMAKLRKK